MFQLMNLTLNVNCVEKNLLMQFPFAENDRRTYRMDRMDKKSETNQWTTQQRLRFRQKT